MVQGARRPSRFSRHRAYARRALVLAGSGAAVAQQPAREQEKSVEGFGESRRGDVPEGTAEMMTPETDKAIKKGLAWLGRTQNADGSFGAGTYRGNIAVTSLCRPGVHGVGLEPGPGSLRRRRSTRRLVYVMDNTSQSGFIAVSASSTHGPMYSHGFGTLFLAEAYGMTHRPEIREKLQKAVRLIIDSQNIEGGWRYQPVRRDADLSVTICQINALRAARNAGLYVPKETVAACIQYVKRSQNHDGGFSTCFKGAPVHSRGRPRGWWRFSRRANTIPRRCATESDIYASTSARSSWAIDTATITMGITTRPRRCGCGVDRSGRSGIRRSATS